MNDKYSIMRNVLTTIDLMNYYTTICELYNNHPISDEALQMLALLDYSKAKNKYSYFKKCYMSFNDNVMLAYKVALFLKGKGILFNIDSCIRPFVDKIEFYGVEHFLIAFNYSYTKMVQLYDSIDRKELYFFKAFNTNLEKVLDLTYSKDEIELIKKQYNF